MKKSLKEILSSYKGEKSELITILQDIQQNFGYLSEESIMELSKFLRVPESEIYGVATFYSQFRFSPIGRNHIMVCTGTACHIQGSKQIVDGIERHLDIKKGEATEDLECSLETVGCLGCCALALCAMINEEVKSKIELKDIKKIFPKSEKIK
ncbi:MAG: NADH-quinone oxidoreductase subunit NuoE [Methanobacterium sp.]